VSKSHLCRVFKKATGQTASQYLNHVRIERACRMLAETDIPIEEIAFASGFNNPSYFFRVFRKEVGKLPLEWRKKHSVASELPAEQPQTQ
jgi:AraC-like DNA-binding protein